MEFRFMRTGKISSINYKRCSARVEYDDAPGVISKELKILSTNSNKTKEYSMPSIGEDVVCIFFPHAPSVGFIVGSYYSGKNLPANTGKVKYIFFPDGTRLKYNLETSLLEIDCAGDINISSGKVVNVQAKEINIVTESFNVSAEESNFDHDINCADVVTDKGSHNAHTHVDAEDRPTTPPA